MRLIICAFCGFQSICYSCGPDQRLSYGCNIGLKGSLILMENVEKHSI